MIDVVLDASVVLKWFHSQREANVEQARRLRAEFEAGRLRALAPPLLWLEILNVAARRWSWEKPRIEELAAALPNLGLELLEPALSGVARWTAAGLTAYDAAYVAVAEQAGVKLITDDDQIVHLAPQIADALSEWMSDHERSDLEADAELDTGEATDVGEAQ